MIAVPKKAKSDKSYMTPQAVVAVHKSLDMSQQAFADKLGVARNTVARWEADLLNVPQLAALAIKSLKK